MKSKLKNLLVDCLALVIFLLLTEPDISGMTLHEWGGILIGVILLLHLILHWKWFVNVTKKLFSTSGQNRLRYFADFALLVSFMLIIWSGIMISRTVLLQFSFGDEMVWKSLHYIATDFTLFLLAVKIGLHWNWVRHAFGSLIKPGKNSRTALKPLEEGAIK